jgi:hypothetical protein
MKDSAQIRPRLLGLLMGGLSQSGGGLAKNGPIVAGALCAKGSWQKLAGMKTLHRPTLFGWSAFDESRNIDFNSVLWTGTPGNVVIDPLPLSPHDAAHLEALGGAKVIVVTNSDHTRDTRRLADRLGARVYGPRAERDAFPIACDGWLGEGDEPVAGLRVLELDGSKTKGELALLIEGHTVVTGDLVRAHQAARLNLLPDAKLGDRALAVASVKRLAALPTVEAVLVGDGWPIFRDGKRALTELAELLPRVQ